MTVTNKPRDLGQGGDRLDMGQALYRRYLEDLIQDDERNLHGMAKARLISGMQVAMEIAYQQGFDHGCKARSLDDRRGEKYERTVSNE